MTLKKYTLFLFIFFLSFSANAQWSIDSLWNIWNNKNLPDDSRFKSIKTIITEGYLTSKPDSALQLSKIMFEMAVEKNLVRYQAEANQLIGQSHDVKSNFPEAFNAFRNAQILFEKINDQNGIADLNLKIAGSYRNSAIHAATLAAIKK